MTKRYFLIASQGMWIASIPASEDEKREFRPSIETNDDSKFEEVTDEYKTQYEEQWEKDHPEDAPVTEEPQQEF